MKGCFPNCPGGFCSRASLIWGSLLASPAADAARAGVGSPAYIAWTTAYPELMDLLQKCATPSLNPDPTKKQRFDKCNATEHVGLPVGNTATGNVWCQMALHPGTWAPHHRNGKDRFISPDGDDDRSADDDAQAAAHAQGFPGSDFSGNTRRTNCSGGGGN